MVNVLLVGHLVVRNPESIGGASLSVAGGVVLAHEIGVFLVELDDTGTGVLGRPNAGISELDLAGNDLAGAGDGQAGGIGSKPGSVGFDVTSENRLSHFFFLLYFKISWTN